VILWGILGWIVGKGISSQRDRVDISPLREHWRLAKLSYDDLVDRWTRETSIASFDEELAKFQKLRDEWIGLPALRERRSASLVANRQKDALRRFLDGFEIEKATISGIGPAKKSMLESFGVETAADVTRNAVLCVPGFGPALSQRLLDWRSKIERRFRFDSQSGVDPVLLAEMDRIIIQRKAEIENELRQGAFELNQLSAKIVARRKALQDPLNRAANEMARAEANLKAVF